MSESVDNNSFIGREVLNYIIVRLLGSGGMGSVYLAENKFINGSKVAIKVINSDMANDFTRNKLKEEAEILTSLNHPNIVRFLNYQIDDAGTVFLIMQFVEGTRLDVYIRNFSGLIVEDRIGPLFEPILDAIEYAHQHNVIHRDIKPSNIVITPEGQPMVLDFGISSIVNESGQLNDNTVIGTPSYMSPELIKAESIDKRSDIYSLGVMLDYMLIGRSPYDLSIMSEAELNEAIVNDPLPRMKLIYPYISDNVQRVVDKATAKNPKDRYQSCAEFKRDLHRVVTPDERKKILKKLLVPVAAVILAAGLGLFLYVNGTSSYYKDYTEIYNVPKGIGKISRFSIGNHSELYRFYKRKGRIERVSHINGRKNVISDLGLAHSSRPADMTYHYSENGKVSQIKTFNSAGRCLYVKSYNPNLSMVTYQYDDQYGTERTVTFGEEGKRVDRITRHLQEYDDKGHLVKVNYASFQNQRVGDEDGIYGERYILDEKGRICETVYLAYDGSPKATKWGLGKRKVKYDKFGNIIRVDYQTVNNQPASALPDDCYSSYECDYDKYGNRTSLKYKDSDNHNVVSKTRGVAGYQFVFRKGLLIRKESIGINGGVAFDSDGYAVLKYVYDKNGFVSKISYYDANDNLSPVDNGVASVSFECDDKGNILVTKFTGLDGNLRVNSSGYAGTMATVDSVGNVVEFRTYGIDWTPCLNSDGCSGRKSEYNNLGLISKVVNIGVDDNPVPDVNGHYMIEYTYDTKANLSRKAFLDSDGRNLFLDSEGVAGYDYKYDDFGNVTEIVAFDENARICDSKDGICRISNTYDDYCNLIKIRFFNSAGKLIHGAAGQNYVYDERGNVIEEMTVDEKETLAAGTTLKKYSYDNHDNIVEESYFDRYGKPCLDALGVHKKVFAYNDRNQAVTESYYGTDGRLVKIASDSYSSIHKDYDARGEVMSVAFYGTDGELTTCKEGYSKKVIEYNANNKVSKTLYYGIDGKLTSPSVIIPERDYEYDEWGNVNYEATCDNLGNLYIDPKCGYAMVKREYDVKGNLISISYYGFQGTPIIVNGLGYHKAINKYDERSHLIECEYFDEKEASVEVGGISRIQYTYGDDNKKSREDNFDKNGKLIKYYTYQYDGSRIIRKTYNANDVLTLTEEWNGKSWAVPAPPLLQLAEAFSRNNLPKQFSLSGGVVMTFRQIKTTPSGKTLNATFALSESMYNTSSGVLSEAKSVISEALNDAKAEMGITETKIKVRLLDKVGREITI